MNKAALETAIIALATIATQLLHGDDPPTEEEEEEDDLDKVIDKIENDAVGREITVAVKQAMLDPENAEDIMAARGILPYEEDFDDDDI